MKKKEPLYLYLEGKLLDDVLDELNPYPEPDDIWSKYGKAELKRRQKLYQAVKKETGVLIEESYPFESMDLRSIKTRKRVARKGSKHKSRKGGRS